MLRELELNGIDRTAVLKALPNGDLTVAVYSVGQRGKGPMLAFACCDITRARVDEDRDVTDLWVGRASFELAPGEAERIRDFLEASRNGGRSCATS